MVNLCELSIYKYNVGCNIELSQGDRKRGNINEKHVGNTEVYRQDYNKGKGYN